MRSLALHLARTRLLWFVVVGWLFFSLALWAVAIGAAFTEPAAQPLPASQPPLQTEGVVEGVISYTGAITGLHPVWVGAFAPGQSGPPLYSSARSGPGIYSITVAVGVYNFMGGMDADDSGGNPDPLIDPIAAYSSNPVTVVAGAYITGVDIFLRDPGAQPGGGAISGVVSYTGQITISHQVIVAVVPWDTAGPPAGSTVLPSPGPYVITGLADGTYKVLAFLDLDDDMGAPQADEPFGWYDPNGDGSPEAVVVNSGEAVTAIDIALRDPSYAIFLPLALK